ncbi:uncharacterized protein LOC125037311 [Penaeus chinensis]|uniref:uncharacterized protein LOC125037311 n=1 Tax=Penaeus chinensis TaxID=139456 RepID=UPI001FB72F85|nr:uncharacterized protein LOC125037311 [Penaeus chinensis]
MAGLLLPTSSCSDPKNASGTPTPAVLRARERDKLRRILEVCAAKVEEAKQLSERLSADGVWISLDTLQRGLMSPTEYRVYQEHLRALAEKEQQKRRPGSKKSPSPYRR